MNASILLTLLNRRNGAGGGGAPDPDPPPVAVANQLAMPNGDLIVFNGTIDGVPYVNVPVIATF